MTDIASNLATVRERMVAAAGRAGRAGDDVSLVAVGKGHPSEAISAAYEAGHRLFGESRGQALAARAVVLPDDIRWHFIGPLQRNKVRIVRPHVELLHSFDRESLVGPWLKGLGEAPPALLQVNIGREPQKAGVEPDDAVASFETWTNAGIRLEGVMAIPPLGESAEQARPYFEHLRRIRDEIADRAGRPLELSMGMTADFEVAIEEGSTMIRVGTAIFGPRPTVETV